MAEKVLSDGEMDALMEGVSSGQVEVQTGAGVVRADVRTFEIHPKSHLKVGSFPELQRINDALAEHLQKFFRDQLNWEVNCDLKSQSRTRLGDVKERFPGLVVGSVFLMPPLDGPGLLVIDGKTLGALVEKFFGSPTVAERAGPVERFSGGELRIAQRFTDEVLLGLKIAWESLLAVEPESVQLEQSLGRIKMGGDKDLAVLSEFQIDAGEVSSAISIVLPLSTLGDVCDALEGADRPGNAEQDAHWADTFRAHLAEMQIPLTATTATFSVNLGTVADLKPGDVLPIARPTLVSLSSGSVQLLHGDFGTHQEKNCVRSRGWITPMTNELVRSQVNG